MGAGGDLGDDAAVARVLRLRVDDVRESTPPVGLDDRSTGVVTGGLEGQDHVLFIAFGRIEGTLRQCGKRRITVLRYASFASTSPTHGFRHERHSRASGNPLCGKHPAPPTRSHLPDYV